MKRILIFFALSTVLAFGSCRNLYDHIATDSPYQGQVQSITVNLVYPEGYTDYARQGVDVAIEESSTANRYVAATDSEGCARFDVTAGIYRVVVSDRVTIGSDDYVLNGSVEQFKVADRFSRSVTVSLTASKPGKLIFKEIYSGGCTMYPESGNYQYDKYFILYNNSRQTLYLDDYCFGTVDPYNSTGTNVWISYDPVSGETIYRDYLPIIQCVWKFPGSGTDFPIEPCCQAVVVLCGAIDHASRYPESVNLNVEDYFVCYDNVYFTNTAYHPTPGDKIDKGRYMEVIVKTGIANAYTFSVNSPTAVLFKVPSIEGSAREYVNRSSSQITIPGGSERCVKVPLEWVADAVEVFNGSSTNNTKRLAPSIDAGYVTLSQSYLHRTLYRNVDYATTLAEQGNEVVYGYTFGNDPNQIDAEATLKAGRKIYYMDTNNSSEDFHERSWQSLHND